MADTSVAYDVGESRRERLAREIHEFRLAQIDARLRMLREMMVRNGSYLEARPSSRR